MLIMFIWIGILLTWWGYYLGAQRNQASPYPQNDEQARENLQTALSYWKEVLPIRQKAHNGQLKTAAEKLSYYYFAAQGLKCSQSGEQDTDFCFPGWPLVEFCDELEGIELCHAIPVPVFHKTDHAGNGKHAKRTFRLLPSVFSWTTLSWSVLWWELEIQVKAILDRPNKHGLSPKKSFLFKAGESFEINPWELDDFFPEEVYTIDNMIIEAYDRDDWTNRNYELNIKEG